MTEQFTVNLDEDRKMRDALFNFELSIFSVTDYNGKEYSSLIHICYRVLKHNCNSPGDP